MIIAEVLSLVAWLLILAVIVALAAVMEQAVFAALYSLGRLAYALTK